ncbi:helix-turn-helix domain-containing protein [Amaricoccus macauensis]|uniref:helix-turn-helix domain-containing protein n=1 Tax=Amaricoccus macauensis TaxID=57001 RepID=UPI003C7A3088
MSNLRARRALTELGENIKRARLARRLARFDLSERAGVSEKTVQRLENGDPGVGIGNLAAVLAALGDPDALARILRFENDAVALSRAIEALPKRGKTFGRRGSAQADRGHDISDDDDEGTGF